MFIHPDDEFDISTLPAVSPAFNLPRWSPASVPNGVAVGFRGGVLHCGGSDYIHCHHFDPARKANPGLFPSLMRGRFAFSMVILSDGRRPWVLGGIHRERLDGGPNIGRWLNSMQIDYSGINPTEINYSLLIWYSRDCMDVASRVVKSL